MNSILNKQFIGSDASYGKVEILKNEVKHTEVYFNKLKSNETYVLNEEEKTITIFFLNRGSASFTSNNKTFEYNEKAVFVTLPEYKVEVLAKTECEIIEIKWHTTKPLNRENFPFSQAYLNAEHYRDACKSDKTISRMVLPFKMIPGFDLGSVQTTGTDAIGKHSHPTKDQIFFSFDNNDIKLLINDDICTLESNTFAHIPLASDHGVQVDEGKVAHYLWIDFEV